MSNKRWSNIKLPYDDDNIVWEYFHENSKISRYSTSVSDNEVIEVMQSMYESLQFKGYKTIDLPKSLRSLNISLDGAILNRTSTRVMAPSLITLENLATILHYSYGLTRINENKTSTRPSRMVPSAGALYPLELFLHSAYIQDQSPGIYHYNPEMNNLRLIDEGDKSPQISNNLVLNQNLAYEASLIIFITAIFRRSTFKYADRGYRFILLEAGHVAQNINLITNGLGLGSINLGGYYDHNVDDMLGLDGITHSTIYIIAIGNKV